MFRNAFKLFVLHKTISRCIDLYTAGDVVDSPIPFSQKLKFNIDKSEITIIVKAQYDKVFRHRKVILEI